MSLPSVSPALLWCIIDFGKGSRVLGLFNELGGVGGTVFLGRGTVKNELLNILGILDIRKEIVFSIIDGKEEDVFFDKLCQEFHLDKPHKGIAFSMSLEYFVKIKNSESVANPGSAGSGGVNDLQYKAIFVIVDKGSVEDVLEAAESAGSTGATVIHSRGSSSKEKETLFGIKIEPEKDIILILSKVQKATSIVEAIEQRLKINQSDAGIIFVLDVSKAIGLYEEQ